jgi:hypothetical protein
MAKVKKPSGKAPEAVKKKTYRQAHKGVVDAGEIVTSAGDEPLSGIIADVTDGDRRRK